MASMLLQVLVLGVIAAAADDVPVTWWSSKVLLPCVVPEAGRVQPRRPPPPLDDGQPRSKLYVWKRDGVEVNQKRIFSNGTLDVRRRENGDGVYQCAVHHQAGMVLGYPVRLETAHLSRFSRHPGNTTARAGQPVTLACDFTSTPPATVSWLRNGEKLPTNNRYHLLKNQLLILDVSHSDAGLYKCIVTNSFLNKNRVSNGGRLTVEDSLEDLEPYFISTNDERTVLVPVGGDLQLPCAVAGWPRPELSWELVAPGGYTSLLNGADQVLIRSEMDVNQEGLYTCKVKGRSDLTKSFNVTVTEPARTTVTPATRETLRASTVRFTCNTSGIPTPNAAWYKDGAPVTLTGRMKLRNTNPRENKIELVISSVTSDDAGVYQCFASNNVSTASSWATLDVTGEQAAEAPGLVTCQPVTATSVLVQWTPVADALAYTVHTTRDKVIPGRVDVERLGQPHKNVEEVVTVPEPLTPFRFQVRAYIQTEGKNVATDLSEIVVCQGQGVPIKLVKADGIVFVSWLEFASLAPGVESWLLQYRLLEDEEHNITLPRDVANYTLPLPEEEPLQIRVLGTLTQDWLPQNLSLVSWSNIGTNSQDMDDGDSSAIPRDLAVTQVGSRGFTVSWRTDASDLAPGHHTFLVCVTKVEGTEECQTSDKTSAVVDNLQPSSEYEVRVQTKLRGREAAALEAVLPYHVITQPDGPQRFKELTYKFVNLTTVRVSWSDAPGRYTVQHTSQLREPMENWTTIETMGNTVLITDIDPTLQTFVMVTGYEPEKYRQIFNIPAQVTGLDAKDIHYVFNGAGIALSWEKAGVGPRVARYAQNISLNIMNWTAVDVNDTRLQLVNLNSSLPTYVTVTTASHGRPGHALPTLQVLTIPPRYHNQGSRTAVSNLTYGYTPSGLSVSWMGGGPHVVRYSQNLSNAIEDWKEIEVNGTKILLVDLNPFLHTHVSVSGSDPLTIPPRAVDVSSIPLGVVIGSLVCILVLIVVAAFCIWRRRKTSRSPVRFRRRNMSPTEGHEGESAEMKHIGGRLANGGGAAAGEPLLNGHVHITENPTSKTPNGKLKKPRFEAAFDVSRYDDPDATLETVIDPDCSYSLLDTSRPPHPHPHPRQDSFNKLPDDNMNSELTRSTDFQLDNSKIHPTLQPNG